MMFQVPQRHEYNIESGKVVAEGIPKTHFNSLYFTNILRPNPLALHHSIEPDQGVILWILLGSTWWDRQQDFT